MGTDIIRKIDEKKIKRSGGSLVVPLTSEFGLIGAKRGDPVRVTVSGDGEKFTITIKPIKPKRSTTPP